MLEYVLIEKPLLRVWLWRLNVYIWKIRAWREPEGRWIKRGDMRVRLGPPWRWCIRVCCGHWHLHIGLGRYHPELASLF